MERAPLLPTSARRPASSVEQESFVPILPVLQLLTVAVTAISVVIFAFTAPGTLLRDLVVVLAIAAFHVGVPVLAISKRSHLWLDLWVYSLMVSLFMPIPNWLTAKILGSVEFGATPYIYRLDGLVPITYCLMWAIPIFVGLALALSARDALEASQVALSMATTYSNVVSNPSSFGHPTTSPLPSPSLHGGPPTLAIALPPPQAPRPLLSMSLWPAHLMAMAGVGAILVLAEFTSTASGLWHPTRRVSHRFASAAAYILPPDLLLGVFSLGGYLMVEGDGWGSKLLMGFLVSLLYSGAVTVSFGIFEGAAF
ncbi:hypothetical protein HDU96_005857 [Phlyctochytrium bullatum]|nr:hypothetical protein HDU96_005857 [Phlyctochytrium bullatum]